MTLLRTPKGLTLTELLVTSVLIGIVMLGVVSVDYATRQSQQTVTQSSQLAMQTGSVMLDIMKNASLATGNVTNPGIQVFGATQTVCIRQDTNTPGNYADDNWVCYTQRTNNLHKCTQSSAASCPLNAPVIGTLVAGVFNAGNPSLVLDSNVANQTLYLQVTLTNRTDPAQGMDPVTNPQYTLTARSSPLAYSHY